MTGLYDLFLHIIATTPRWAVAILLGWVMSITITQPLKFIMPIEWSSNLREWVARVIAFATACITTVIYLPTMLGWALGFIVGVWSPVAYFLVMKIISHRWPWLADVFSGDVRGVLIGRIKDGE
jgi:hypothetical protein